MTTSSSGENKVADAWISANDPVAVGGIIVPGVMKQNIIFECRK